MIFTLRRDARNCAAVQEKAEQGVHAEAEDHGDQGEAQDAAEVRTVPKVEPQLHASSSTMAAAIVLRAVLQVLAAGRVRWSRGCSLGPAPSSIPVPMNRAGPGTVPAVPVFHDMLHVVALVRRAEMRDDERDALGDGHHGVTGPALACQDIGGGDDAADVFLETQGNDLSAPEPPSDLPQKLVVAARENDQGRAFQRPDEKPR